MRTITRRTALAGAASLAGLSILPRPALASSTIRINGIHCFSGPFALAGQFSNMGCELAIDVKKTINSKALEYASLDEESNPGRAVRRVQEAIQQGGQFFVGANLSSTALAVMKEVHGAGGAYITMTGADEITGSDCNSSTFRWSVATYGAVYETVLPLIEKYPNAKRWYTITPQYVFGESLLSAAKEIFASKDIEHVGNSYHSLQEAEFSGYLANAIAEKPDVLLILNFAGQSNNTLRTAISYGMHKNMTILLAWSNGLEQAKELGPEIMENVYFGSQYWHTIDTEENRRLVKLADEKFGRLPDMQIAGHYACTNLLLSAMEETGAETPAEIKAAISGRKYAGITGPEEVRAFDHQVIKDYYLLRGKPKDKMADANDFADVISFGKTAPSEEKSVCKLEG